MDILVTRRLTLRPPLEVDAEAITAAFQNSNITRNLTTVPSPYMLEDALDWIEKCRSDHNALHYCIYRQSLLGVASVSLNKDGEYDLGYWLDEPHWSNGYVTEAARAVLSQAFRKLGPDVIGSGAYDDNPGSLAVLDKLGFEDSGVVEKHTNPTRGEDVTCLKRSLSRERFERLFGPLDPAQAA